MALSDEARRQFIDALREDANFRADVRREILTAELLALPATTARLAKATEEATLGGLRQVLLR